MKIADAMLIGGGMAYTFLKAQGLEMGKSMVETDKIELAKRLLSDAKQEEFPLLLPVRSRRCAGVRADATGAHVSP